MTVTLNSIYLQAIARNRLQSHNPLFVDLLWAAMLSK